jgi:hypothetical protein
MEYLSKSRQLNDVKKCAHFADENKMRTFAAYFHIYIDHFRDAQPATGRASSFSKVEPVFDSVAGTSLMNYMRSDMIGQSESEIISELI